MNLLQETRDALARAGKGPEDVVWCGSKAGAYWCTWAWDFHTRPTVKGDGIVPTPGQLFRTKGDYGWSSEIEPQPWRPE